jgi:hypothetical protein
MNQQRGFFDEQERLQKLSNQGDPLEKLNRSSLCSAFFLSPGCLNNLHAWRPLQLRAVPNVREVSLPFWSWAHVIGYASQAR